MKALIRACSLIVTVLFVACPGVSRAERAFETTTREEKLLNIEIGSLTPIEKNRRESGYVVTLKTDKQLYYLCFFGIIADTGDLTRYVQWFVSRGRFLSDHHPTACLQLAIEYSLKSDGTLERPRVIGKMYHDRTLRYEFQNGEWGYRQEQFLHGELVSEKPVAKGPPPYGDIAVTSTTVLSTEFSLPCLITVRKEVASNPNSFLKGVITYDPPTFFRGFEPRGDPGENPFSGRGQLRVYHGTDNDSTRHRQLNIDIQEVGFSIGEGKRVSYTKLSDDDLKKLMGQSLISDRATNSPNVEDYVFAGHKALKALNVYPEPLMAKGTVMHEETIWVRIKPNQVLSLTLDATSEELLDTIRDSLKTFRILIP